ncbi:Cytochrome P450 monooxygenase acrts1 [Plenodomus lindquistii]|nr:Cytochrome P450 monooxygenase acrts1 [Plenodomus lindquistii]
MTLLLQFSHAQLLGVSIASPVVYLVGWVIYARFFHPIAKIPGPLWPAVSRTWLMWRMYLGDLEIVMQYGPLVRIAPDEVHTSDPSSIPVLYPTQNPLQKTDYYDTFRPYSMGPDPDLFTDRDEKHHAAHRRNLGSVYTLSSVLKNETTIDKTTEMFVERIGGSADRAEKVDFGLWLERYAFDNVGAVFFGKQFGFVEHSFDYGDYIASVHIAMRLNSVISMAPLRLRRYLLNVGLMIPKVLKAIMAADGLRKAAVRETGIAQESMQDKNSKRMDLLSQLLVIKEAKAGVVTIENVHIEMWAGIMAGGDSTSGALRAIFYLLMKNPKKRDKLVRALDAAFEDGTLTHPVQYNQAMKIPYLKAVVQESLRMFAPFGVPLPRHAPVGGLQISGYHIPPGTKIGMIAMVCQHDKGVFGKDADEFSPERWLESEERFRAMDKAMLVFGAGTRTCIGQHLSYSEMYKLVPEMLRLFTVEMAHDGPWKTHNASFILQSNIICNLKRREM